MEDTPTTQPAGQNRSAFDRFADWLRRSVMLKLLSVAIVLLLLLVPQFFVLDLVNERQYRRTEAVAEVSSKWGAAQTVGGAVLTVPYRYQRPGTKEDAPPQTVTGWLHILPDSLGIAAELTSQVRKRGIFRVPLYEAAVTVHAHFEKPGTEIPVLPQGAQLLWENAYLETGVTDIKGIQRVAALTVNGRALRFQPSLPVQEVFPSGIHCPVPLAPDSVYAVQFQLVVRGSEGIRFLPYGKRTTVTLQGRGTSESPSFQGAFLPENRAVTDSLFSAHWLVLDLNRDLPTRFTGTGTQTSYTNDTYETRATAASGYVTQPKGAEYSFGVDLLALINPYQQTARSTKYAVFFIFLTFLTLFFSEVLATRRVHVVQYLLIGFTIVVFYVVLLALTEHIGFEWAYILAALIITVYITLYIRSAFDRAPLTRAIAGLLVILYGFFYSLLQLEDYALLMGSLGLLVLVGAMLYITRKVDWYAYGSRD